MSPNKSTNIIKYCVLTSTAAIVLIAISLIPVSRKAAYWNRCLDKTVRWLNEKENGLKGWDKASIESIAAVDVITQYLMIFGLLLGDIKKEGFIPLC